MPCPTCDHTMQSVRTGEEENIYWCNRCGTMKIENSSNTHADIDTPMIVGRLRDFIPKLAASDRWESHRIGIVESIYPPHERDKIRTS